MHDLERQQRGLLALLKGQGLQREDPYLSRVAESAGLPLLQKIARWWIAVSIEAQCRYTSRLLKRTGDFECAVEKLYARRGAMPFIEELGFEFLRQMIEHEDVLVRSVAAFERAALLGQYGRDGTCEILWDRHPEKTVSALEYGEDLPEHEPGWFYRLQFIGGQPPTMQCSRESVALLVSTPG
jgi:hypothetical protein